MGWLGLAERRSRYLNRGVSNFCSQGPNVALAHLFQIPFSEQAAGVCSTVSPRAPARPRSLPLFTSGKSALLLPSLGSPLFEQRSLRQPHSSSTMPRQWRTAGGAQCSKNGLQRTQRGDEVVPSAAVASWAQSIVDQAARHRVCCVNGMRMSAWRPRQEQGWSGNQIMTTRSVVG